MTCDRNRKTWAVVGQWRNKEIPLHALAALGKVA
jgi:hypothetical protein